MRITLIHLRHEIGKRKVQRIFMSFMNEAEKQKDFFRLLRIRFHMSLAANIPSYRYTSDFLIYQTLEICSVMSLLLLL